MGEALGSAVRVAPEGMTAAELLEALAREERSMAAGEWRLSKNGKETEKIPVEGPAAANGLVVVMGGGWHKEQFAKMRSLVARQANHQ
jgi:hypothetical protein